VELQLLYPSHPPPEVEGVERVAGAEVDLLMKTRPLPMWTGCVVVIVGCSWMTCRTTRGLGVPCCWRTWWRGVPMICLAVYLLGLFL
jgi:hypothetical protein